MPCGECQLQGAGGRVLTAVCSYLPGPYPPGGSPPRLFRESICFQQFTAKVGSKVLSALGLSHTVICAKDLAQWRDLKRCLRVLPPGTRGSSHSMNDNQATERGTVPFRNRHNLIVRRGEEIICKSCEVFSAHSAGVGRDFRQGGIDIRRRVVADLLLSIRKQRQEWPAWRYL